MEQLSDVGLIGLGVMGENLALNMERNGRRLPESKFWAFRTCQSLWHL